MEAALRKVLGHGDESDPEVVRALDALNRRYPADLLAGLEQDTPRMVEHVSWVKGAQRVLDIGGGYGPFALLLHELGAHAAVVDTFDHELFEREDLRALAAEFPVEMVALDATGGAPLPFEDDWFDCIASFDSLEHWHHSPRRLFQEVRRIARPGALFVLGVPNAVNVRKRFAVLAGKNNWSHFEDWYEPDRFLGHVREPVVADLERMADELRLEPRAIVGRNWLGARRGRVGRTVTAVLDAPLRLRPSLCSNLYLAGRMD